MSDEQNVWKCIVAYRGDAAKKLATAYNSDLKAISAALKSYPKKSEYHGHVSGKSGDSENASNEENLKAAIAHLVANAPKKEKKDSDEKAAKKPAAKPAVDKSKKAQNEMKEKGLLKIIEDGTDLGKIRTALTEANPNWESIRSVKGAVDQKAKAKKLALANKKKGNKR